MWTYDIDEENRTVTIHDNGSQRLRVMFYQLETWGKEWLETRQIVANRGEQYVQNIINARNELLERGLIQWR